MLYFRSAFCALLLGGPLLLLPLVSQAAGNQVNHGVEAYSAGDEVEARRIWSELANSGDIRAQFYLSILYGDGQGNIEDKEIALKWLQRAAQNGSPPAQFNLGHHYLEGRWLEKDVSKGVYWWERAAEKGWTDAQFNLATLYLRGMSVEQDREKSRYWYQKAADGGSQQALEVLQTHFDQMQPVVLSETSEPAEAPSATPVQEDTPGAVGGSETADDPIGSAEWVMGQAPSGFTIQLFSSAEDDQCQRALRDLTAKVGQPMALYPYQKRQRNFCAVLMGSFPHSDDADRVISKLPGEIQAANPIVRRFKTLQRLSR